MIDLIQVAGARGGSPAVTPGLFPWAYAPCAFTIRAMASEEVSPEDKARAEQVADSIIGQLLAGQRMTLIDEDSPRGRYLHALIERRRQEHLIDIGRSMGHLAWVTREQAEQINEWYASRRAIYARLQSRVRRWRPDAGSRQGPQPVIHISHAGPWRLASRL